MWSYEQKSHTSNGPMPAVKLPLKWMEMLIDFCHQVLQLSLFSRVILGHLSTNLRFTSASLGPYSGISMQVSDIAIGEFR